MGVRYVVLGNTFQDTNYRMLVAQIDRLHAAIPDRDITVEDLRNGLALTYQGSLLEDLTIYANGLANIEPAHDSLVRGLIARELAGAAAESLLASQNGELDLDTPSATLERARDCLDGGLASPVVTLDQLSLPSLADERGDVIPLGISAIIDNELGGAGAGELICFLAPPRRGKTTIMRMVGANMVQAGYNVLDITLETGGAKIGRLYERAMVHTRRKDHGDADAILAREMLAKNGGKLWLKDLSHVDVTPDNIEGLIRAQQRDTGERVDAVVLDYLELMTPAKGRMGDAMMRYMYGRLGKQMRAVGRKFGIPIITAWQVNREGSQKDTISEADISECWDLFKHVDMMIALNRTAAEKQNGMMRLGILKQREDDDAPSLVTVHCDYSTMTIHDVEKNHALHTGNRQSEGVASATESTGREPEQRIGLTGGISIYAERTGVGVYSGEGS